MASNLLPCPFCGGPAKSSAPFRGTQKVWCNAERCENKSTFDVDAWNRRATQPAAGEPFAWIVESPKDLEPVTSVCKRKELADRFASTGWTVTAVYTAPPAAPVAAGEPVTPGVNYADEVDLIRAVLEGYSPSIARTDALCSVKLLKAYFAAPPAAAHGDEAARKAQKMGYGSVTEALADLEQINARFAQPTDGYDPDAHMRAQGAGGPHD